MRHYFHSCRLILAVMLLHMGVAHASLPIATPAGYTSYFPQTTANAYAAPNAHSYWQTLAPRQAIKQQLQEWYLAFPDSKLAYYQRWLNSQFAEPRKEQIYTETLLYMLALQAEMFTSSYPAQMQLRFAHYRVRPNTGQLTRFKAAIAADRLEQLVVSLAPQHPWYPRYQAELQRLLTHYQSDSLLNHQQQPAPNNQWFSLVYPEYSPENQLKAFQRQHGLKPDGIIGKNTQHWLELPQIERIYMLARNMQRLRFLPEEIQRSQILINVPDYQLEFWQAGSLTLRSRTVVGKPDRQTPMLESYLSAVISNPPWNVPYNIMRKDILPKLRSEPNYLAEHGFRVVNSGVSYLKKSLPLDQFDWQHTDLRHFPYLLQQSPGSNNALGQIKFNMPNSQHIYLHHTNAPRLFSHYQRALSSGCIRVERAFALAEQVLQPQLQDWQQALSSGETNALSPEEHIRITTYYLTAWPQSEQQFAYRQDIYNFDPLPAQLAGQLPLLAVRTTN